MRHTWRAWCLQTALAGLLATSWGVLPAGAQDAKQQESTAKSTETQDEEKPATLRDRYKAMIEEYNKSTAELRRAMLDDEITSDEHNAQRNKKTEELVTQLQALIAEEPKNEVALDVHLFLARTLRTGKVFDESIEAIITNFGDSERLAEVATMVPVGTPKGNALMERIIEVTPHDSVKGKTMFRLAEVLSMRDDEASEKRGIELLQTIQEKYADIDMGRGRKLGDGVEGMLFAIQNLKVGKVAPDIIGKDIDDVEFKLSDYRGKVVVLDFWGDW